MQQNEIEKFLANPDIEEQLWEELLEVQHKITNILTKKDDIRNEFLYSLQAGVSTDQIKVQTSNVSDLSQTLTAANKLTDTYHKELTIRHNKIVSQIDACRRIYLIKGSLKPFDKKLIKLRYEKQLTWKAIEIELNKERSTLSNNLNQIVTYITNCFNSNITNEQLARTQSFQSYKPKTTKQDKIPGQITFDVNQN